MDRSSHSIQQKIERSTRVLCKDETAFINSRTGFQNNLSRITYHSEQVILQLVTMKLISATFVVMLPFFGAAVGLDSSGKRRLEKTCKCAPGCVDE